MNHKGISLVYSTKVIPVVWMGDSLEVMRSLPKEIRARFGAELRRLQINQPALVSRPMRIVGKGVFELKCQDSSHWYRVLYALRVNERIVVLHCFRKYGRKTATADLEIARRRFSRAKELDF